jgi:hypothetical protein
MKEGEVWVHKASGIKATITRVGSKTIRVEYSNNLDGIPKRDGSGRGVGANRGRGGCKNPTGNRKGRATLYNDVEKGEDE